MDGSRKGRGARALLLAPLLGLMTAACVPAAPPVAQPVPEPFEQPQLCGAEGLQGLVGQPESVLATMRFSQTVRVIHPGTAVTMDFSPFRLNILIDATGRITRVYCG